MTLSDLSRNAACTALADLLRGGTLEIRSGDEPESPSESGTLLGVLGLGEFKITNGQAKAIYVQPENRALASGTIGHYLGKSTSGKIVCSGSAGLGNVDIVFDSDEVVEGGVISLRSFLLICPAR